MRVLLLGGTTEASRLAQVLKAAAIDAVFSYAGRTASPVSQPLPTRIGGFGGISGLLGYLKAERITHVVDATHPFAAAMSTHAFAACRTASVPLIRFERPAWRAVPDDNWRSFAAIEDIPGALPETPARVFLAIGKQHIDLFATAPQHHYLLRLVDPPQAALPLPNTQVVIARGPFDLSGDLALMRHHAITHVVAKNSGGSGARAKLDAARALGVHVLMAERPTLPGDTIADSAKDVMTWLDHSADRGV